MWSTGEPDKKRRQIGPLSPTAAKKQPVLPCSSSSADKKLDVAVLQFKNEKLVQQLEVQRVECSILHSKFHQLKEKQQVSNDTLALVNKSWQALLGDLSSSSKCRIACRHVLKSSLSLKDDVASPRHGDFLSRLLETGATESSSGYTSNGLIENDALSTQATRQLLEDSVSSVDSMWRVYNELTDALLAAFPKDEANSQLEKTTNDLQMQVAKFREEVGDLHVKHKALAGNLQNHRDMDAKNKVNLRLLKEDLASTAAELEDCSSKLALLKAQKDPVKRLQIPFPTLENKYVGPDMVRNNKKELQDLELMMKNLTELASSRLLEITNLHEERLELMKKITSLKNTLKSVKNISCSKAFQLLGKQLETSKSEMDQYRASLEKLQVEKDNMIWLEKEVAARTDLADVSQSVATFYVSRIADLQEELQKLVDGKILMEKKLQEALKEPGRKEIIAEFKALVSSLPKDMGLMQSQLSEYKEAATEIHSLRAEVQSLSSILNRKENELETLSVRSLQQQAELTKLHAMVQALRESDIELKLILEMYKRESTESREVTEARSMEYQAWAHVQSLNSSLDEKDLEHRVKEAIQSEATSQQRLAVAEAEIAELRQKLDVSGRDIHKLTEILQSKHEEGEVYLSEIESIGQAYEDMRTQNQHLLQQITQRDDYNLKLVMEGVKGRQVQDAFRHDIQTMGKKIHEANSLIDTYDVKIARLEDQLKIWSEQVSKCKEDGWQQSFALENAERRLSDVRTGSQHLRQSLEAVETKVERSRTDAAELLIELEKERFRKKRIEEELEVLGKKAANLRQRSERSMLLERLQREIKEYRGMLKCGVCEDRQKEVVIAKCYHLFCSRCVQKSSESRHRKCPACGASFGPNDVKPIYI